MFNRRKYIINKWIMIEAIIFDMDGTVIDSTRNDFTAWTRVFDEYDYAFSFEEYVRVLGAKGSEIIEERLELGREEVDKMLKRKESYFQEELDKNGLRLIPHVEELLKEIKSMDLKTALATGSGDEKLKMIFERLNIEQYFDVILTADDVQHGKPDPEIFLNAAKKLGVSPEQAIVMEDAENGVRAAKAGNMLCIAITSTHTREKLQEADLVIDNYKELHLKDFIKEQTKLKAKTSY